MQVNLDDDGVTMVTVSCIQVIGNKGRCTLMIEAT